MKTKILWISSENLWITPPDSEVDPPYTRLKSRTVLLAPDSEVGRVLPRSRPPSYFKVDPKIYIVVK
nr:MAG TPA: hypothetical protein [Bacteriophage sp.]